MEQLTELIKLLTAVVTLAAVLLNVLPATSESPDRDSKEEDR